MRETGRRTADHPAGRAGVWQGRDRSAGRGRRRRRPVSGQRGAVLCGAAPRGAVATSAASRSGSGVHGVHAPLTGPWHMAARAADRTLATRRPQLLVRLCRPGPAL